VIPVNRILVFTNDSKCDERAPKIEFLSFVQYSMIEKFKWSI